MRHLVLVGFLLGVVAVAGEARERVSHDALAGLVGLAVGESLRVEGLALGGDRYGAVELERIAHYAPGAEVWVVEGSERRVLDRSGQRFFSGRSASGDSRLVLMRDAQSGDWSGVVYGPAGLETLRAYSGEHGLRFLALPSDSLLPDGVSLDSSCAVDQHPQLQDFRASEPVGALPGDAAVRGSGLRLGVLGLDTDKEWLDRRFSNNTSAAATWFEQLMLASNLIFESDVNLRMQQGHTVLRVDSDPYTVGGSSVSQARLEEFGQFWFDNFAAVQRTHAALVSGRSGSGNSAQGIAWVDSYCRNQASGGSYSLNQLFWSDTVPLAFSVRLFAHEVGHNLGSRHTHCYNPPVDQCFNAESGCYSGPVSCPAGGPGTLMSYCHMPAPTGANCGPALLQLAPQVATRINQSIMANFPNCIVPEDQGVIFQDRFE